MAERDSILIQEQQRILRIIVNGLFFFALGALEVVEKLKIHPDIVHCNDWQTGLVPVYLKTKYAERAFLKKNEIYYNYSQSCIPGVILALGYEFNRVELGTF